MTRRTVFPQSLRWVDAIWVLVGLEVLLALYAGSFGPLPVERYGSARYAMADALLGMIRTLVAINGLAIGSLWTLWRGAPRRRTLGAALRHVGPALVLALLTTVFLDLRGPLVDTAVQVDAVYRLNADDTYSVRTGW